MICPCCGKPKKPPGLDGLGTALKPAMELICLARKPLARGKTIAGNVLTWGTGALNIDACRVGSAPRTTHADGSRTTGKGMWTKQAGGGGLSAAECDVPAARWPANVIHDGSPEVVERFPETAPSPPVGSMGGGSNKHSIFGHFAGHRHENGHGDSGSAARFFATFPQDEPRGRRPGGFGNIGADKGDSVPNGPQYRDGGSVSRYFYTAKADADDRIGSRHPTVKPLDLIQWLCRLITPPKGHILDCFAGTGTTAEAALREGFRATLIEKEPEYIADIDRRMALALDGSVGRSVAMAKLKPEGEPLPLFAEAAE